MALYKWAGFVSIPPLSRMGRFNHIILLVSMNSPNRLLALLVLVVFLFLPTSQSLAQSLDEPVTEEERRAVVARIVTLVNERYVFPESAQETGDYLNAQLEAGAFDELHDPAIFAEKLTATLQHINHDKHMRVRLSSGNGRDPIREFNSKHGFETVEVLDGNIGYIDMRGFLSVDIARETATEAMETVAEADAVIFDMRNNGGGRPDMVQWVSSYFFAERTHLNSLYWRETDTTQEFWTLTNVPGKQMAEVPLFVLTSSRTFSAAEEFTYNLQSRNRATIIGETTGGGAHPGKNININDRFRIFIPTGRAINPVTGTNWEGTGVKPDIEIDADQALEKALELAKEAASSYKTVGASDYDSNR